MKREARAQLDGFFTAVGEANEVSDVKTEFNVLPHPEQRLEELVRESSAFLKAVNHEFVDDLVGEKVGIGVNAPLAGRTDTSGSKERTGTDVSSTSSEEYRCWLTEYDAAIKYSKIDAWRHKPDFQLILRRAITKQIGRDRLAIGFNGTHAAADTDKTANPLLQDVNKGWLQHIRESKPESVLTGIKIGAGGDYNNADAAVYDAINSLIAEWHKESDLVVIVGSSLLAQKYLNLINQNEAPTERKALEDLMTKESLAGKPTLAPPFFLASSVLITPLENLSIYTQTGSTRMHYRDMPEKKKVVEFRSVNEDYVIEDYDACALLDGILLPDGQGGWA